MKDAVGSIPYRMAFAGGWIDQPWMSSIHPGSMVTVCLEPTCEFSKRAGMATSTRETARKIWGERIPDGDRETIAKILFGAENPPGTEYVSGSQDAIGLVYPGINRLYYNGAYWPAEINTLLDREAEAWLEDVIHLVPIGPRPDGYFPLAEQNLKPEWVRQLGQSGEDCWRAILNRDPLLLGRSLNDTLQAWKRTLPNTVPDPIMEEVSRFDSCCGRGLSGCGGGFVVVVSEEPVESGMRIKVKSG